ncbi:hypothetical protein AMTRI_Chr08g209850 [Amborella trichopoda]|uniref:Uncharacterized protein n=1 Tax=Amborella trichopoda TaxID=13333 RepID=W1P9E5_AMBTC|nr:nuclear-pore anchor [Amborella trichopoda]XP_020521780.1 nuclear-pore anchor [Amborella trichopoda]XP_020521781.1 nuclear-pore anchor [Amborella trichopoda]XP_020521782.1 nuclear-pore anchor [Amborella trichopoda]XP_020521783.1 nuclear-pore anchor [Amborella trichopoda]XP_020521784.1 nuclear-pore anchor [Amborella trichopoda]XP_020521785.1 nuclear-pore anchor [Amborella trichopoda]XP_020521786.1 nuclear-pore anchor [Amborella trichopoda]XP_020521787.1 nuclear-pore anchor [Amborella trich|eukprot:XP_020521778.1 nuclear-pore anchor [Amborella trichopoda]
MPLFLSDEELRRLAGDGMAVAERADAFIRELQAGFHAQMDAGASSAEESYALVEQKFVSLSSRSSELEARNARLTSTLDERTAEIAKLQAETHQLQVKAISKDSEVERLSVEVSELHQSKRQLLELLEQKDSEINEKNAVINSYLDKIVKLTDTVSLKEAKLHDGESELSRSRATCARLAQEKELIEKHNAWLNDELTSKVNSLLELRRSHAEYEVDMSAKLADVEKQLNQCTGSLKWNKERVKELEERLAAAQEELCSSKNTAAAKEEQFSAEIVTATRLVELYKESSEEWSKKAGELEGVIKALETHSNQVEDDYKEKLERQTTLKNELEKEAASLKEKLEKCEQDIENARKENELDLLQLVSVPVNSTGEATVTSLEGRKGVEGNKMIVPKMPYGVSGTALAASLLRDGWSLAKMYTKYQEAVDALRHEQLGRKQSEIILERVLYEIEEKAKVVMHEREENGKMLEAYTSMNEKLQQALSDQAGFEKTIRELKADLKQHERDSRFKEREIEDLKRQVVVLLKECRDIQLRYGVGNGNFPDDAPSHAVADLEVDSETDKVISENLLTFKGINGLLEQNVKLRSLVRSLTAQVEQNQEELKEAFHLELRNKTEEAASKVEAVLRRSEEQVQMIESLHSAVGMYKRLYEEEVKNRAAYPPLLEAIPDDGRKDLLRLFEGSQEATKKAYEQAAERAKSLEEEVAKARSEATFLRLERDKLAMEAKFARERLDNFVKDSENQRNEANAILARNVEFSQMIIEYQRKLRESAQIVQASDELSQKLSVELSLLKHEKDILVNAEKRASEEVVSLTRRVHRLQASLDTFQSAEEVREEARTTGKRKLEEELQRVQREWAEAKRELQEEREHVRHLTNDRERTLKDAMRQVEDMGNKLTNALQSVAAAEARAAVSEARCIDLQAKLKHSEDKFAVKGPGTASAVSLTNEAFTDLQKAKEEIQNLKDEARSYKDHMLQFKHIAQVNEDALKQIEVAHHEYSTEAEKMKRSLEAEIGSLRRRISELESDLLSKDRDTALVIAEKEASLSSALAEIVRLNEMHSAKISQSEELEIRISSLKEDLEKEHMRWRTAQNNYERQVILQSETIQELTRTSEVLALLQDEASQLRKTVDALRSENDILKATWTREKTELEMSKVEAEKKYKEIDEVNKILLNRLEALDIRLAERERSVAGQSPDKKNESDLQNVIGYLRRSKEIAETEISLLKQERLRLQTQLESALKACERTQSELNAEHANSRTAIYTDEEFKSLELQVRELNLLRESNMQLRQENKHNFDECQRLHEVAQKANAEVEHLGRLLKEKEVELEASHKELEKQKSELGHWENRVSKLLESYKNIDVGNYENLKADFERVQENLVAKEAELEELKKISVEKEEKILQLELELESRKLELTEMEKKIQDATQIEDKLKAEIERLKKLTNSWRRKAEAVMKEKEELNREKQALSKQLEDYKSSKRSTGETPKQHETIIRQEQIENEKDTRIQTLEKLFEKEREELRKERVNRKHDRKIFEGIVQKAAQEKKKLEEELKHMHARDRGTENSGLAAAQLSSETELDEKTAGYFLAIEQMEEAAGLSVSDSGHGQTSEQPLPVDTLSSAGANDKSSRQVSSTTPLIPPTTETTPPAALPVKGSEEHQLVSKPPMAEARKFSRKIVRPKLERPSASSQQQQQHVAEVAAAEATSEIDTSGHKGNEAEEARQPSIDNLEVPMPTTSGARKRLASSLDLKEDEAAVLSHDQQEQQSLDLTKKSRTDDQTSFVTLPPLPADDQLLSGESAHISDEQEKLIKEEDTAGLNRKEQTPNSVMNEVEAEPPHQNLEAANEAEPPLSENPESPGNTVAEDDDASKKTDDQETTSSPMEMVVEEREEGELVAEEEGAMDDDAVMMPLESSFLAEEGEAAPQVEAEVETQAETEVDAGVEAEEASMHEEQQQRGHHVGGEQAAEEGNDGKSNNDKESKALESGASGLAETEHKEETTAASTTTVVHQPRELSTPGGRTMSRRLDRGFSSPARGVGRGRGGRGNRRNVGSQGGRG